LDGGNEQEGVFGEEVVGKVDLMKYKIEENFWLLSASKESFK
jgi:hypothetical protein